MKKLYSPNNDSELALIKSILDGEGIPYFVHNDHFGTLKVGPKIELRGYPFRWPNSYSIRRLCYHARSPCMKMDRWQQLAVEGDRTTCHEHEKFFD